MVLTATSKAIELFMAAAVSLASSLAAFSAALSFVTVTVAAGRDDGGADVYKRQPDKLR